MKGVRDGSGSGVRELQVEGCRIIFIDVVPEASVQGGGSALEVMGEPSR